LLRLKTKQKMADDDDWDAVPINLNVKSALKVDEDDERVELEEVTTKETSKPKNAVDDKTALARATVQSKAKQKEREEELARIAEKERNARALTPEEKAAEALRLRRLQEESEASLVQDLFGGSRPAAPVITASAAQAKALDGVQDIESLSAIFADIQLDTPRQHVDLAEAISRRLEGLPKKAALTFLKEFLRIATNPLNDEDVNDLLGTVTVIKNDKVKARLAKKKAAAAPKPKLNTSGLEKAGGDRYDMDDIDERGRRGKGAAKNPYDDDDFM